MYLIILLWLFATFEVHSLTSDSSSNTLPTETGPERILGFKVKTGTAQGYIEDKACQTCHPVHWKTYQQVGMSKSFVKPAKDNFIENFEAPPFYHPASQRYYKIARNGDELIFNRYQLDTEGKKINIFQQQIDWILGSGHKTRSYLYQTDMGEIFQLPLGWYESTQQWLMGPGYEKSSHIGVQRLIRRECMFCHNAFPEMAIGSDSHWQPHVFPKDLPEGTGCQRCHGPGANHVRTVINGGNVKQIKSAIVNPASLSIDKRDSVCFQCHMLPTVAVIGIRRFDRNDFSYRPGELISDYLLHVDIEDPELAKEDRFEINHHAYRLRQSKCFAKSQGKLTCISCHDPHKKVPKEQRIKHYGSVCLSCHQKHLVNKEKNAYDCISCHMPQKRTQDVVHVVMTDHKIQVNTTTQQQRLATLAPKEPIVEAIDFLLLKDSPNGIEGEIYKSITLLRSVLSRDLVDHIEKLLAQSENIDAYINLAEAQIKLKRYKKANFSIHKILSSQPDSIRGLQLLGSLYIIQGKFIESKKAFDKALALNPNLPDVYFNLGLLHLKQSKFDLAQENFDNAINLRPIMIKAWYYSASVDEKLKKFNAAIKKHIKALEIDPSYVLSYASLAKVYLKIQNKTEAIRYLKHGIKVNNNNSMLVDLLAQISPETDKQSE